MAAAMEHHPAGDYRRDHPAAHPAPRPGAVGRFRADPAAAQRGRSGAGTALGTASERPAWLEHETAFEKTVKICVFVVVIAAVLYPFLSVLATSLASEPDVIQNGGLVIWPTHPTLQAYHTIFAGGVV